MIMFHSRYNLRKLCSPKAQSRLSVLTAMLATSSLIFGNVYASTTLTVYTDESFTADWGPGPIIKEGFEKQCGDCTLNFVALDSSAGILNRVQLEGKNTKADVIVGLNANQIAIAEDSGLLAPSGVDTSDLQLPIEWDSDTFVPYDFGYFAFIYDTEALSAPPTNFEELIASPDEGMIIIQDPRTSTTGFGLLLWLKSIYGDEAAAKWEALQPRILTVTKGFSEAYFSLFLNGEAPMVLSYSTSPGYHMEVDKTERYQAVAFDEGHYLQVELAALLKSSPNKELGQEFLRYLIDQDAQATIPLGNVMYPVVELEDGLPESFSKLIEPASTRLFSSEEVRDNRRAWIDEWLESSSGW